MIEKINIVMARKPLSEKSVAENVLKWGTGGLNIDDCRIPFNSDDKFDIRRYNQYHDTFSSYEDIDSIKGKYKVNTPHTQGRFPANIIFDEEAGEVLDKQSGVSKSGKKGIRISNGFNENAYGKGIGIKKGENNGEYGDKGGASRFFKQIKKD